MQAAGPIARTWPVLVLAAGSVVVALAGLLAFQASAPYLGTVGLLRQGLPAVLLGLAAVVVALSGRHRTAPVLLSVAAVAAAAPGLSIGLQQRWQGWVLVGALGLILAPAVVGAGLTFPAGRLPGRGGQLVTAVALVAGTACALATTLAYDPAAWSWCRCVGNPLSAGSGPGAYLHMADAVTVVQAGVAVLGLAAFAATRARACLRGVRAVFAVALVVLLTAWTATNVAALVSEPATPAWLDALADAALLLLPILYVAGYAGRRPSRAHVADLLLAVREEQDPARLRSLVARALGDPQAVVAWWQAGTGDYRDHLGRPVEPPEHDVLRVEASGTPVALVVSDRVDWVGPGVSESLAEALRLAAENRRLTAELQATLDQVRESRARILTASDDARRRVERDLHDGAQQLLISTGIKLNLAATRAGSDAELVAALDDASRHLSQALVELRNVASGIAPAALVHGSLRSALQDLALRGTVPTTVRVTGDADTDEATAATIYFVVAECLTNVAKHAHATRAAVDLELGDPIRLAVSDDGGGGAVLDGSGSGLRGLVDRVDARGGRFGVDSSATGTTVSVVLPLHALELDPP